MTDFEMEWFDLDRELKQLFAKSLNTLNKKDKNINQTEENTEVL